MIRILLFLCLLPASSAAVELTAAGQMGVAKTAWNEAGGDPSLRAVIQVMFRRAELSGESLLSVISRKHQFEGYTKPWRAEPRHMAEVVMLVAEIYESGDFGKYTNFWPVYKIEKGKKVLNPMPRWWQGHRTKIGGHWFGAMPFVTNNKKAAAKMLKNLAASSDELARMIYPSKRPCQDTKGFKPPSSLLAGS